MGILVFILNKLGLVSYNENSINLAKAKTKSKTKI